MPIFIKIAVGAIPVSQAVSEPVRRQAMAGRCGWGEDSWDPGLQQAGHQQQDGRVGQWFCA